MSCVLAISDEEPPENVSRKRRLPTKRKPIVEIDPVLSRQRSLERAAKSAEICKQMMELSSGSSGSQPDDIFAPTDLRLFKHESDSDDDDKVDGKSAKATEVPVVAPSRAVLPVDDLDPSLLAALQRAQANVKSHEAFVIEDSSSEVEELEEENSSAALTIQIRVADKPNPIRVKLFENETFVKVQQSLSTVLGLTGRLVFDGRVIPKDATPKALELEDGDALDLVP